MKVYFLTRFSIYDPKSTGFVLTRNVKDPLKYKKTLFSPFRLDSKFKFFFKITVKSILNQKNKDFKWFIFTSNLLPQNYKFKLLKLAELVQSIEIFFVRDFDHMHDIIDKYDFEKEYATVRIDDDDGVSPMFTHKLQKYSKYDKTIISFTHGRKVTLDNLNRLVLGKKLIMKNRAQGMTGINMNIYRCGNHVNVHQRYPIIYDPMDTAFLMGCSKYCDTRRPFQKY